MPRAESSSDEGYYYQEEPESVALCIGSQVQTLRSPLHIVCLVLNILLPGWGTMVSAFSCVHKQPAAATDNFGAAEPKKCCSCGTFTDGMLQFYLAPLLFGWIWSIMFGVAIYQKGRDSRRLN